MRIQYQQLRLAGFKPASSKAAKAAAVKQAIADFDDRLMKLKPSERHVLLFVHGYNTRFEEAVYRFAQIAHDAGAPGDLKRRAHEPGRRADRKRRRRATHAALSGG